MSRPCREQEMCAECRAATELAQAALRVWLDDNEELANGVAAAIERAGLKDPLLSKVEQLITAVDGLNGGDAASIVAVTLLTQLKQDGWKVVMPNGEEL